MFVALGFNSDLPIVVLHEFVSFIIRQSLEPCPVFQRFLHVRMSQIILEELRSRQKEYIHIFIGHQNSMDERARIKRKLSWISKAKPSDSLEQLGDRNHGQPVSQPTPDVERKVK